MRIRSCSLIALAVILSACTDMTGPNVFFGSYHLHTINNTALPAAFGQTNNTVFIETSNTVTFAAHGAFSQQSNGYTLVNTVRGQNYSTTSIGTYEVSHDTVYVSRNGSPLVYTINRLALTLTLVNFPQYRAIYHFQN